MAPAWDKATDDDIVQAKEQLKRLNNNFNLLEIALSISTEYGERACNWRYLSAIIDSWLAKGYQTEEELKNKYPRKGTETCYTPNTFIFSAS